MAVALVVSASAHAGDLEGLRIGEIAVSGADQAPDDLVRTAIRSGVGGLFDPSMVTDDVRRIYALGRFTDVQVSAAPGPHGVAVTFTVVERPFDPKLEVTRIQLVGVGAERRSVVAALPDSTGKPWDPERLEADRRRVADWYADEGFASARIHRPRMQVLPDRTGVVGVLTIEEGPVYRVGVVEGLSHDGLGAGEPLRRKDLIAAARRRMSELRESGHARARVAPRLSLDPHTAVADVRFFEESGPLMRLGRVDFTGNARTRDRVLRRDLAVREGQQWSDSGLVQTRRHLMATGLFESVVVTELDDGVGEAVDVQISVEEHDPFRWKAGGGAASEEVWLTAAIAHNNLLGRAWTLELSGRLSQIRSEGEVAFRDPRVLDSRWSVAVRGGARRLDFLDARRWWDGGSVTVGRWLTHELSAGLTYEIAREGLSARGSATLAEPATTSSIGLTTVWRRDHRLTWTAAPRALGTSAPFWEMAAHSRQPVATLLGVELSLHGRYQRVGTFDGAPAPAHRKYYWGGPGVIRGYPQWSVGPADRAIVGSAELSWPLPGEERIGLLVFGDAGRVGQEGLTSAGGGVWARVGPGRVRVECGVPLNPRAGDEGFACDLRLSR